MRKGWRVARAAAVVSCVVVAGTAIVEGAQRDNAASEELRGVSVGPTTMSLGEFNGVALSLADGIGAASGMQCLSAAFPATQPGARPEPNDGITTVGCDTPARIAERGITLVVVDEERGTQRAWVYAPSGITSARVEGRAIAVSGRVVSAEVGVGARSIDLAGQGKTIRVPLPGM